MRVHLSAALMLLALALGVLRCVGLFGNPLGADGGLFLIVTMAILSVVLYPHRKDSRGR